MQFVSVMICQLYVKRRTGGYLPPTGVFLEVMYQKYNALGYLHTYLYPLGDRKTTDRNPPTRRLGTINVSAVSSQRLQYCLPHLPQIVPNDGQFLCSSLPAEHLSRPRLA
jgi:hypothetical protein